MASFTFYVPRVGAECTAPAAAALFAAHGLGRVLRVDIIPHNTDEAATCSANWAVPVRGQKFPRAYAFIHCEDVPHGVISRVRNPAETFHLRLPQVQGTPTSQYWVLAESTSDALPDQRAASHELTTDGRSCTVVLRSDAHEHISSPIPSGLLTWPLLECTLRRDPGPGSGGLVVRDLAGFVASRGSAAAGLDAWLAADDLRQQYHLHGDGRLRLGLDAPCSRPALHRLLESIGAVTTCCSAAEWIISPGPDGVSVDIDVWSSDVPRLQLAAQMVRDLCTVCQLDGDLALTLSPPRGLSTTYRCAEPNHVLSA